MALDPSEYSVKELRDEVVEIDDPGELRQVLDAEREGKDRKTARRTLERRLEAVTEGASAGTADTGTGGEADTAGESGTAGEAPPGQAGGGGLRATAMEDARRASGRLDDWLAGSR